MVYQPAAIKEAVAPRQPATGRAALTRLWRVLAGNRKATLGVVLMLIFTAAAVFAPLIAPYDPTAGLFGPLQLPSAHNLLGTTSDGKDIFSQLLWGTRQSLMIAILAGLFATVLSVLIGISAAYVGGLPDLVLGLVTDIFLILPALPLMIIIAAYYRGSGVWIIIAVIVITGWSYGARQLRAQALSLRNREFLQSARVRGESSLYIILFELLPTMTSLIVANFLGAAVYAVLTAAGLQFIGLGNTEDMSWGTMLYFAENNEALASGAPLWAIAPGLCIALLGAAFALLNYAFDEIGNPALRSGRRKRGRRRDHS
ncbi:MAG TPA: ABC transporter permease [Chloroflexota bacterium]|nr:ABC transporter permease [Chloroflexota bacterium]